MHQKIKYELFTIKDSEYKIRQDSIMCAVRLSENEALSNFFWLILLKMLCHRQTGSNTQPSDLVVRLGQ